MIHVGRMWPQESLAIRSSERNRQPGPRRYDLTIARWVSPRPGRLHSRFEGRDGIARTNPFLPEWQSASRATGLADGANEPKTSSGAGRNRANEPTSMSGAGRNRANEPSFAAHRALKPRSSAAPIPAFPSGEPARDPGGLEVSPSRSRCSGRIGAGSRASARNRVVSVASRRRSRTILHEKRKSPGGQKRSIRAIRRVVPNGARGSRSLFQEAGSGRAGGDSPLSGSDKTGG
jgi:hypothetical protein